jgi:hypothetical protein
MPNFKENDKKFAQKDHIASILELKIPFCKFDPCPSLLLADKSMKGENHNFKKGLIHQTRLYDSIPKKFER